jgi:hypothetical protein
MKKFKLIVVSICFYVFISANAFAANVATITLGNVKYVESLYDISLHVLYTYDSHDPLEFDITVKYNSAAPDWAAFRTEVLAKIKPFHTNYMKEEAMKVLPALDTTVGNIKTAMDTYINN